jgi:hypothetical protein
VPFIRALPFFIAAATEKGNALWRLSLQMYEEHTGNKFDKSIEGAIVA